MDKLQKWGKELQANIRDVLEQFDTRQGIINKFLFEKLSDEDMKILGEKLIAHDKQTREDRDAIKQAEFDKTMEKFKMKEKP